MYEKAVSEHRRLLHDPSKFLQLTPWDCVKSGRLVESDPSPVHSPSPYRSARR